MFSKFFCVYISDSRVKCQRKTFRGEAYPLPSIAAVLTNFLTVAGKDVSCESRCKCGYDCTLTEHVTSTTTVDSGSGHPPRGVSRVFPHLYLVSEMIYTRV